MRSSLLALVCVLAASGILYGADSKPAGAAGVSADEANEGFVSLFDGKTLDGWQGSVQGYAPENGVMVCKKEGGGMLFTAKEYADFVFRFEFKLEPGANNGVGIRTPLQGNPAYVGMEIQILDDGHDMYKGWLKDYQCHGSIYGVVPAKRGHLKPVGEWNSEEISCKGRQVKITLNGTVIVDADLDKVPDPTPDHQQHPGLKRDKGYIGWLGHGSRIEFRNIRIKELK
jgi:hypothetical protein